MKRFALPSLLAVLVFAQACTDATSPDRHATLTPKNPTLVLSGNVPPPPTAIAINITVSSALPVTGAFTGVYFANPSSIQSAAAADEVGDASLLFSGTAWLRLDNMQAFGSTASANARFSRTDQKMSGMGTLVILGHTIRIDQVTAFGANPECTVSGEVCAFIEFTATVDGESGHTGTAEAFDREFCVPLFNQGEFENETIFQCGGS